jgi:hypothetical protein
VKRALIDRAVAEKAKRHAIFISIFTGEGQAASERDMRSDNGVSSIHMVLAIEKMHRTAESMGTPRGFAKKFRHAGIGARSPGESMRMIAISRDDIIIMSRRRHRAADDRFLPDVKVAEATDLLRLILLTRAFLKTPDQQHEREHLDFVALLRRRH